MIASALTRVVLFCGCFCRNTETVLFIFNAMLLSNYPFGGKQVMVWVWVEVLKCTNLQSIHRVWKWNKQIMARSTKPITIWLTAHVIHYSHMSVSNHRPLGRLLTSLFRLPPKLSVTAPLWGEPSGHWWEFITVGFPVHRSSNTDIDFMWRHPVVTHLGGGYWSCSR